MEKAEISRLINSFNAIKGYFDTTKRYMPQIAKLVYFIEEVIPLLQSIQSDLHQSTEMIPSATEKLGKVTSATEMATTEVMDIVDNVIARLDTISSNLDAIEEKVVEPAPADFIKEKVALIRDEISGSQDDLFSIMNALQFQDITTQQINSIGSVIDTVQNKLGDLLKGFDDEGINFARLRRQSFDPNAEFDFDRSAESQRLADEVMKLKNEGLEFDSSKIDNLVVEKPDEDQDNLEDMLELDENGQPKIDAIIDNLKTKQQNLENQ